MRLHDSTTCRSEHGILPAIENNCIDPSNTPIDPPMSPSFESNPVSRNRPNVKVKAKARAIPTVWAPPPQPASFRHVKLESFVPLYVMAESQLSSSFQCQASRWKVNAQVPPARPRSKQL